MTDWTTCRVVRDRTGRLRLVEDGTPVYSGEPTGAMDYEYDGPFTPVLDADGLPVVRTVGDLTARHIGARVRVEGWGETVFREVFPTQHGARCMFADGDHEFAATLDIPCEVLA